MKESDEKKVVLPTISLDVNPSLVQLCKDNFKFVNGCLVRIKKINMLLSEFVNSNNSDCLCDCFVFDNQDGFFNHRLTYFCSLKDLLSEFANYTVSFSFIEHTSSGELYQLILTFIK